MTLGRLVLLLAAGCGGLSAWPAVSAPAGPTDCDARLREATVQLVQSALTGEPNRKGTEKARVALVMLAASAQRDLTGPEASRRVAVRDAALVAASFVKEKKYAEARQQVAKLASLAGQPKVKQDRVQLLGPHLDIEEVMSQFRQQERGGLGIEAHLDRLTTAKDATLPATDLTEELRLLAYRSALAAELTAEHMPAANGKLWQTLADDMRRASLALGAAVQAQDGKAAFEAVGALVGSCNKCHKEFR